MNNIRELAELYGVTAKTPDSLNIFITEVYCHGYHDGKEFSSAPISLRDHFAGLAMQSYIAIYCNKGISDCPDDCQIAEYSYHQADAMIAERNEND